MIDQISYEQCSLCKACSNACPVDAIAFCEEKQGFLYPKLNSNKCVGCNRCEEVCPVKAELTQVSAGYPLAYAARSRDPKIREKSTSGGIFYEAARTVIQNGGYACGAIFDRNFQVVHTVTNDLSVLKQMRGSKYAQSDIGIVYREIRRLLIAGHTVLFCGCPCQTAGLSTYLGKSYENLILIDFICHGISSQKILDSYRQLLEQRYKAKIKTLQFRNKQQGWHSSSVKIEFENAKVYSEATTIDAYMKAFLSATTMKESCYTCRFKGFRSGSDLTLGDLWGAEVTLPEMDDNTGLSAVFVNTEKGQKVIQALNIDLQEVSQEMIVKYNRNLLEPSKKNRVRSEFFEYAGAHGFGCGIEHYFRESRTAKIKRKSLFFVRCIYHFIRGKGKPLY